MGARGGWSAEAAREGRAADGCPKGRAPTMTMVATSPRLGDTLRRTPLQAASESSLDLFQAALDAEPRLFGWRDKRARPLRTVPGLKANPTTTTPVMTTAPTTISGASRMLLRRGGLEGVNAPNPGPRARGPAPLTARATGAAVWH